MSEFPFSSDRFMCYFLCVAQAILRTVQTDAHVVSAVFSVVTQRLSPQTCGEERCVTTLKAAARETNSHATQQDSG